MNSIWQTRGTRRTPSVDVAVCHQGQRFRSSQLSGSAWRTKHHMRSESLASCLLDKHNARVHMYCTNIVSPVGRLGAVLRPTIKCRILDLNGVDQVLGESDSRCIRRGNTASPNLGVRGLEILDDVDAARRHLREEQGEGEDRMTSQVGSVVDDDVWRTTQDLDNSGEVGFARLITLHNRDSRAQINILLVQVQSDNSENGKQSRQTRRDPPPNSVFSYPPTPISRIRFRCMRLLPRWRRYGRQ